MLTPAPAPVPAAFSGATLAFLRVNLPPARMFLGDAGSLTIGFAAGLSTIALANANSGPRSVLVLVGPVAVAMFDTSLVVVSRLRAHRPVQVGGTDHFSHRLLRLGFSRRQVLGVTGLVTVCSLMVTFLAQRSPAQGVILGLPLLAGLAATWVWLQGSKPYGPHLTADQATDREKVG